MQTVAHADPPAPGTLLHLRPTNAAGVLHVALALATTTSGLTLAVQPGWLPWGLGQVMLALGLVQWFVLLHESGHGTLFRSRPLNLLAGHLAGLGAIIPYQVWRRVHGRHHRWTGWQDLDPTTAVLIPRPLSRPERWVINACWRLWIPLFSILYRLNNFWNVPRVWRLFPESHVRRQLLLNVVMLLAAYVAVAIVAGPAVMVRAVGVALILSFILQDVLIVSQHTHVPMGLSHGEDVAPYPAIAQEPFTRSLRLPSWLSFLTLHFDAHELHHMYPFVPGYRLDRVPYAGINEVVWWRWIPAARRVRGEVFFFQNRNETGFDL